MNTNYYDIIIVGAGATGCVLASRLSELTDQSILLIEAGHDEEKLVSQLDQVGYIDHRSDWQLIAYAGNNKRRLWLPRGKLVGGSSLLQGGVAMRGPCRDYDQWGELAGNSWNYTSLLKDLKRIENDADFGDQAWHGGQGPIYIKRSDEQEHQPLHIAFIEACLKIGISRCKDFNAPQAVGIGKIPLCQKDGVRLNVRNTYLASARKNNENLTIRPRMLVHKILCQRSKAIGIEGQIGKTTELIYGRQIIISAGAIGSPAILLRSGIGPEQMLKNLGINVQQPLPGVGKNLRDHPSLWLEFEIGHGYGRKGMPWFQVMLRNLDQSILCLPDFALEVHYNFRLAPDRNAYRQGILSCALLGAEGAGQVRISSNNPKSMPIVNLAFQNDSDVKKLTLLLAVIQDLLETSDFKKLKLSSIRLLNPTNLGVWGQKAVQQTFNWAKLQYIIGKSLGTFKNLPNCKQTNQLETKVRNCIISGHHLHGSCAMGKASYVNAVVDKHCRVFGFENLFVVDASVIPFQWRANPHLTCVMLGETMAMHWISNVEYQ